MSEYPCGRVVTAGTSDVNDGNGMVGILALATTAGIVGIPTIVSSEGMTMVSITLEVDPLGPTTSTVTCVVTAPAAEIEDSGCETKDGRPMLTSRVERVGVGAGMVTSTVVGRPSAPMVV